jgi:hypothetical protein
MLTRMGRRDVGGVQGGFGRRYRGNGFTEPKAGAWAALAWAGGRALAKSISS